MLRMIAFMTTLSNQVPIDAIQYPFVADAGSIEQDDTATACVGIDSQLAVVTHCPTRVGKPELPIELP